MHPYPIACAYQRLLRSRRQNEAYQRSYNLLLDLHEIVVRFLTLITLSSYLQQEAFAPAFNERLCQMLRKNLSLGDWVSLLRETTRVYQRRVETLFIPELFPFYFKPSGGLTESARILERFVELRNSTIGHMLTLTEPRYEELYMTNLPLLSSVLEQLNFLAAYRLLIPTEIENGRILSAYDATGAASDFYETKLDVYAGDENIREYQPILIGRFDPNRQLVLYPLHIVEDDPVNEILDIMLFDGLKIAKDTLTSLRYLAIRRRSKIVLSEENSLHSLILKDCQHSLTTIFKAIEELIEPVSRATSSTYYFASQSDLIDTYISAFVGRKAALDAFHSFCANRTRGIFFVMGVPGQGKSALAAKIIKDTGAIHHFIARDEARNVERYIIQSLISQLQQRYELLGKIPDDEDELRRAFSATLQDIRVICEREHRNEIIVLDGLDELLFTQQGIRLDFLPNPLPAHIYVLLTSRPMELAGTLATRIDQSYELEPLSVQEVELLVRGRFPEASVDLVAKIFNESRGNPLYIRCVLAEFSQRQMATDRLPATIEDLYRGLLLRLQQDGEELAYALLGILTVAYEGLSINELAIILHRKKRELLSKGLHNTRTFLVSTQGRYRIFHKSMRDFLTNPAEEYAFDSQDLRQFHHVIVDACQDDDQILQSYKLQYLPYHLYDVGNWDEIVRLSASLDYTLGIADLLVSRIRQYVPEQLLGSPVDTLLRRLAASDSTQTHTALLAFFSRVVHYGYLGYCRNLARSSAEDAKKRDSSSQWFFLFAEARIAQAQGDLEHAMALLTAVEPHLTTLGAEQIPEFLCLRADTLRESGHYDEARVVYEACRDALGATGDRSLLLDTLLHLGDLEYVRGELSAAKQTLIDALALAEQQNLLLSVGQSHRFIGHILYIRDEFTDALDHYHQALDIFSRIDDQAYLGRIYMNLAETYVPIDLERALSFAEAAVALDRQWDFRLELGKALFTRADIVRIQGRFEDSARDLKDSIEQLTKVGHLSMLARAYRVKALMLFDQRKFDEALVSLDESDRIFKVIRVYPTFLLKNMLTRLELYRAYGDKQKTREISERLKEMSKTSELSYLVDNYFARSPLVELNEGEQT
jgi:tetratricopeptide (TPR) repeat protein